MTQNAKPTSDDDSLPTTTASGFFKFRKTQSRTKTDDADDVLSVSPSCAPSRALTGRRLWSAFVGFMISVLLVQLDQTIVATALPRIASQFHRLNQSAWIATSYLLTLSGFILTLGQVLTMAPAKTVFLASLAVFEVGSLVCATAHSFPHLLIGRAIAGCGGAGITDSVMVLVAQDTELKDRSILFGFLGSMYALSSIIGPLIGGAFTDRVTWRWCFYINLPVGFLALLLVILLLESHPPLGDQYTTHTFLHKWIVKFDWPGGILCLGTIVSLLLALQWGGTVKPWHSATVIALFVVFGVLGVVFLGLEYIRGVHSVLPLRLFARRTQIGACLAIFFLGLAVLSGTYYLPLWYQAQGHSATRAGIDILPFLLSTVIALMISGGAIKMTGRYWYSLVFAPFLCSVGAGLLSSLNPDASTARLIGYQIIFGVGIGAALQNGFIAVQAEWADDEKMIPQATTLLTFLQLLGGAIGVAICGAVFTNQLHAHLTHITPALDPALLTALEQSVTVINTLPVGSALRAAVVDAYAKSVRRVFLVGVPAGGLASLSALLVKNVDLNVKERERAERVVEVETVKADGGDVEKAGPREESDVDTAT